MDHPDGCGTCSKAAFGADVSSKNHLRMAALTIPILQHMPLYSLAQARACPACILYVSALILLLAINGPSADRTLHHAKGLAAPLTCPLWPLVFHPVAQAPVAVVQLPAAPPQLRVPCGQTVCVTARLCHTVLAHLRASAHPSSRCGGHSSSRRRGSHRSSRTATATLACSHTTQCS